MMSGIARDRPPRRRPPGPSSGRSPNTLRAPQSCQRIAHQVPAAHGVDGAVPHLQQHARPGGAAAVGALERRQARRRAAPRRARRPRRCRRARRGAAASPAGRRAAAPAARRSECRSAAIFCALRRIAAGRPGDDHVRMQCHEAFHVDGGDVADARHAASPPAARRSTRRWRDLRAGAGANSISVAPGVRLTMRSGGAGTCSRWPRSSLTTRSGPPAPAAAAAAPSAAHTNSQRARRRMTGDHAAARRAAPSAACAGTCAAGGGARPAVTRTRL